VKQVRAAGAFFALLFGVSVVGCAGSQPEAETAHGGKRDDPARGDGARCEFRGRVDREVSESVGTGALQPSIRRVYRVVGEAEQRRRILVCREVDTNLDGTKDLVRRYNDQGEAVEEQADSNYDGKLDTWIRFSKGRIAQVDIDSNRDDSPDETRYYVHGKLSRVQRDTNHDGKPDIWEIYAAGHLERMGVDVDHDGRVDRWNRDEVALHQAPAAGGGDAAAKDAAETEGQGDAADAEPAADAPASH
jgi:DNA-binding transcriptional MerR regulator